ncbi:DNA-formamidopyrimidine glycosylase family protein [uncultured Nocardioides sp.]|uniref:DNA-formamidopyrimidine glycosylase family protein n=1 Tax=uncultured Nocardioides sp. TaxID=198441 RepID=UPI002609EDB8|nr:DNA-formamidopyrimidine glycosylase family protein [uncultured Nocardioides sp.]
MPEGDSVYKNARKLDRVLAGRVLERGDLRVPQLATTSLAGRTVLGHDSHGKHLLTRFSGGLTLHSHQKMEGTWKTTGPGKRLPRHFMDDVRVLLAAEGAGTAYGLRLAVVELVETAKEHEVVGYLGPDPLREDWDAATAVANFRAQPQRQLAPAMLDQRIMAGLGNLWANELAFLLGHSPWTPVADVDVDRMVALAAKALRHSALVKDAYQVTTGVNRPGQSHWVIGRGGKPCRRCGTEVRQVQALVNSPDHRRTSWCPHCQPGPGPETRAEGGSVPLPPSDARA